MTSLKHRTPAELDQIARAEAFKEFYTVLGYEFDGLRDMIDRTGAYVMVLYERVKTSKQLDQACWEIHSYARLNRNDLDAGTHIKMIRQLLDNATSQVQRRLEEAVTQQAELKVSARSEKAKNRGLRKQIKGLQDELRELQDKLKGDQRAAAPDHVDQDTRRRQRGAAAAE